MNEFMFLMTMLFSSLGATRADVGMFVQYDKTNEIQYTIDFDCVQFSETLVKNAEAYGFDAFVVQTAWNTDNGIAFHEFVAFNTIEGIVWIEPQNDMEYTVTETGNRLCHTDGECVSSDLMFIRYDH